jgi:modulator of FtsH protease HflK
MSLEAITIKIKTHGVVTRVRLIWMRHFVNSRKKFSGNKGSGSSGSSKGDFPEINPKLIGFFFLGILIIWGLLGIYQVDQQEKAVVLTFGRYSDTVEAGLHWNPPLVDSVQIVNVTKVRSSAHKGLMLTEDDNIVEVSLSVQYTVSDPKEFLLKVRDPEVSLEHAAESALRHVVGSNELHQVLTEGRAIIAIDVKQRLQDYLDLYETGIQVSTVNIEDAQPPKEVQAAFDDVIRAKEDEARVKNEAETYKNGIIPEARGLAQRQTEEANGYKEQVIARAEGEAQRFTQLLVEYERAPEVTRQRLYIDTMQKVMSRTSKVMVDVDGGNLLYLPLDKLMGSNANVVADKPMSSFVNSTAQPATGIKRETSRESVSRGGR